MHDDSDPDILQLVRRYASEQIAPLAAKRDRDGVLPREEFRRLGELGLLGITVSPEWGGIGASTLTLAGVIEEISAADASIGVVLSTHHSLACKPIEAHGTKLQKERFLHPW